MRVLFIRPHKDDDGNNYEAGQVVDLPKHIALRWIREGIAKERREERGPEETKKEGE